MNIVYAVAQALGRFVKFNCLRVVVLHGERAPSTGGYVLACTHLSHLEPCILSFMMHRPIDWMARIEFYRYHLCVSLLDALDAFPVDRQGISVSAVRTAIRRVREGRIVGIFPEGGVVHGAESAVRGGGIKRGACVVAYRSAAPVVPVVVVGTDKLNRVGPWLPFRRGRVWMIFGEPIHPRLAEPRRRVARELMARDLQAAFQSLFGELCSSCGIDEREVA